MSGHSSPLTCFQASEYNMTAVNIRSKQNLWGPSMWGMTAKVRKCKRFRSEEATTREEMTANRHGGGNPPRSRDTDSALSLPWAQAGCLLRELGSRKLTTPTHLPAKKKEKPHWSSVKLQHSWHGSAESPDSAYWSCRLRRQQGCRRGGHRGCCALLGQRLLLLRLVHWGSSRKRRLHLGRKLCWWRRRRLSWRRMENLGLWARWHGWRRRNRGWDCCCWWLLSPYARGSVVRGGGATRYGWGWVLMQSWLRERGTVNVAPLRPRRHYRRVHRTGRTGHLCLLKGKTKQDAIQNRIKEVFT